MKRSNEQTSPNSKRRKMEPSYQYIYPDLLINIFPFLPVKDLTNASLVCKEWNSVSKFECIWEILFKSRFAIFDIRNLENFSHWRENYKDTMMKMNNKILKIKVRDPRGREGWDAIPLAVKEKIIQDLKVKSVKLVRESVFMGSLKMITEMRFILESMIAKSDREEGVNKLNWNTYFHWHIADCRSHCFIASVLIRMRYFTIAEEISQILHQKICTLQKKYPPLLPYLEGTLSLVTCNLGYICLIKQNYHVGTALFEDALQRIINEVARVGGYTKMETQKDKYDLILVLRRVFSSIVFHLSKLKILDPIPFSMIKILNLMKVDVKNKEERNKIFEKYFKEEFEIIKKYEKEFVEYFK